MIDREELNLEPGEEKARLGYAPELAIEEMFRSLTANRWWLWVLGIGSLLSTGFLILVSFGFMLVFLWPWLILGYLQVKSAWLLGKALSSKDTRYYSRSLSALSTYFLIRGLLFAIPVLVIITVIFLALLFGDGAWFCLPGDDCQFFFRRWYEYFPGTVDV